MTIGDLARRYTAQDAGFLWDILNQGIGLVLAARDKDAVRNELRLAGAHHVVADFAALKQVIG